jgi:hypothetical protein
MFKLWLTEDSDIRISWLSGNGNTIRIVYPTGVYEYETDYGPVVLASVRKNKFKTGQLASDLKKMVERGHATVKKIQ